MSARTRQGLSRESLLVLLTQAVDDDLRETWGELRTTLPFYNWVEYHMGWRELAATGPAKPGKHLRSLLLVLVAQMFGGGLGRALPLASAVELLHSATLVFDDIQDAGPLRRGRPAMWRISGAAQAINVGAALQASVHAAALRAQRGGLPPEATLDAVAELVGAMLRLAEGQYLDLRCAEAGNPGIEQYLDTCARKAAALVGSAAVLGVLAAGRPELTAPARRLGHHLGMYLQISDDIDGIWGRSEETGKLADDLPAKRRTLPVLYAFQRASLDLGRGGEPGEPDAERRRRVAEEEEAVAGLRARFFGDEPLRPGDVETCLRLLERCDARAYTVTLARLHAESTAGALAELEATAVTPGAIAPLLEQFSRWSAVGALGAPIVPLAAAATAAVAHV